MTQPALRLTQSIARCPVARAGINRNDFGETEAPLLEAPLDRMLWRSSAR